jgi:hypothetical protein
LNSTNFLLTDNAKKVFHPSASLLPFIEKKSFFLGGDGPKDSSTCLCMSVVMRKKKKGEKNEARIKKGFKFSSRPRGG